MYVYVYHDRSAVSYACMYVWGVLGVESAAEDKTHNILDLLVCGFIAWGRDAILTANWDLKLWPYAKFSGYENANVTYTIREIMHLR